MKKALFIALAAIVLAFAGFHLASIHGNNRTIKVLFIGNSLTSVNNLPTMIASIAGSHGYEMVYDS